MRKTRGGACRLHKQIARYASPEERSVEKPLSYQARREVLQQAAPQYREASSSQKRTLLDAFVSTTGYHRTYARWLLNHAEEVQEWEEIRPGLLEADLVAHCGADIEGGYLYTLTLTDIATGWTE